jgi:hypothetical protein
VRRAETRGLLLLLAPIVVDAACLDTLTFDCEDDAACVYEERQGVCVEPGRCAYPDDACDSLLRFGPAAGPDLASTCVDGTASSGAETPTSTTAGCDACEATPGECIEDQAVCIDGACVDVAKPEGAPCLEDDPCVIAAACDAAGECIVTEAIVCDDPPAGCWLPMGACAPDGSCEYEPRNAGAPCEDGDGCTLADECDGSGNCVSGHICPNENPCAAGSCDGSQCSFFPVVDGTTCGEAATDICCGGACVDTTTDALHCGACDGACPAEQVCAPVEDMGMCMPMTSAPQVLR